MTKDADSQGPQLSAGLGPLPERDAFETWATEWWMLIDDKESAWEVWRAAKAAERERCAKLAEGAQHLPNDGKDFANGWRSAALQIAQAIRRA